MAIKLKRRRIPFHRPNTSADTEVKGRKQDAGNRNWDEPEKQTGWGIKLQASSKRTKEQKEQKDTVKTNKNKMQWYPTQQQKEQSNKDEEKEILTKKIITTKPNQKLTNNRTSRSARELPDLSNPTAQRRTSRGDVRAGVPAS